MINTPPTALLILGLAAFPVDVLAQGLEETLENPTPSEATTQGPPTIGVPPTTPPLSIEAVITEADPPAAGDGEPTMADLKVDEVNAALYTADAEMISGANPLILKAQVMLDRAGASPGVIDAYYGENVDKAIAALETVLKLPIDGRLDPQVWAALGGDNAAAVLIPYAITEDDLAGPFVPDIPADYSKQAKLDRLAFTGPVEMFSERFHMDVDLLTALNPEVDFSQAGNTIVVAAVDGQPFTGTIVRIDVDKALKQLRAYDADDRLVVAYPATIGSDENPSPAGIHTVDAVALEPFYNYDPKNFIQGDNHEKLTLPPGPNNPVGSVWIGLSEPGYGIHGTPEPSKIDKTGSHGCIRLTNWDGEELARLVQVGAAVSFLE